MLCSIHVASVVQMTHMLLCHGGIMKSKALDRAMHWGTYWAALVHDYDHRGLNNDFLIKTAHPLAITYSDQSPLENHHIAAATMVFLQPECQYIRVSAIRQQLQYACVRHAEWVLWSQVVALRQTISAC